MTPIEQAICECEANLCVASSKVTWNRGDFYVILRQFTTTLTKPLEDENKRLREALENNKTAKGLAKAHLELLQEYNRLKNRFDWYKENHRQLVFIPSAKVWQFQYLIFIDLGEAIDKAKALTKPT